MPPPMMRRTLLPRIGRTLGPWREISRVSVGNIRTTREKCSFFRKGRNAMNISLKNNDLPPFKPLPQKPPSIDVTRKPDGTVYVASRYPLGQMHRSIAHLLEEKAAAHPERNFIAERTPLAGGKTGDWRFITYGEANAQRIGRGAGVARARPRSRYAADGDLGQFDRPCRDDAGRDEGARAGGAGVGRLFADVRRSFEARHVFETREAEDDLRGAGPALCARAGRPAARRRGSRDRHADPGQADDIVRRADARQCRPAGRGLDGEDRPRHGREISLHVRFDRHAERRAADARHDVRGDRGDARRCATDEPIPTRFRKASNGCRGTTSPPAISASTAI